MRFVEKLSALACALTDGVYLGCDKRLVRRTRCLRLVPSFANRRGGKISYGEWCHVIGIFQTLFHQHLSTKTDNHILDVGCGSGILAIASEPFLGKAGSYTGIDVMEKDVRFCQRHYPKDRFSFQHLDVSNRAYAPQQDRNRDMWSIGDARMDLVTALSVWTHLNEEDAVFYFHEIDRVLKPGAKAIVTFFLLDEEYYRGVQHRTGERGRYHNTRQDRWVFDRSCSQSGNWFCPEWAKVPENAIGLATAGIDMMLDGTRLSLTAMYPGNWREAPGVFFQDVLVFEKGTEQSSN